MACSVKALRGSRFTEDGLDVGIGDKVGVGVGDKVGVGVGDK